MASSQLSLLCEQIEQQETDHFGKFYMYISLLNTITQRTKPFVESLPTYSNPTRGSQPLNTGEISPQFLEQINLYALEFGNLQPNWWNTIFNIVITYLRKGKISDLTHILDKMLYHLRAIHAPQSYNQNIYSRIHFNDKKADLANFITQVAEFNQLLLSKVDSCCNTALAFMAIALGLTLILATVFSFTPMLIGLGLIAGGAYAGYHFISQLKTQMLQVEEEIGQLTEMLEKIPSTDAGLHGDKNHYSFFTSALLTLSYAGITAAEQLIFNPEKKRQLAEALAVVDKASGQLAEI